MVSDSGDLSVIHNYDDVGILDRGNSLRDDDLGGVCKLLAECASDLRLGGGVDCAGGVIENVS